MKSKIINLEMNEVSPSLLAKYIEINKNSNLAKLMNLGLLNIYTTKALDIEKENLYPSQTWASFNTGKPYSKHKCYWYSDNIKADTLLWNKLAANNISVGIIGSIHSSKFPKDLISNENYKFYLPDCFSSNDLTKPITFSSFQSLNNKLVGDSSRVTGLNELIKTLLSYSIKFIKNPRRFGISIFSIKMILKIIFLTIFYRNKEILRMGQFPLLASIFVDLCKDFEPDYSTLFSNHVAGNMHRYWYAHDITSFKNKNKYSKKWISKNKKLIYLGIDFIDDFIGFLLKKNIFKDKIILITSSMGQEPNPNFDNKFLSKYDGKIKDINLFLKHISIYIEQKYGKNVDFICSRNMAPQYGFSLQNSQNLDIKVVLNAVTNFLSDLGLVHRLDEEDGSIVLSIDPYTDRNLQEKFDIIQANKNYKKYGFQFFPVEDHHSGSHHEDGSFVVINSSQILKKNINKFLEDGGYINYLNFPKIILDSF